jgi:hypothetical protein
LRGIKVLCDGPRHWLDISALGAACGFARATGKAAAIGDVGDLGRIIAGEAGTTIASQVSGIEYAT